VLQTSGGTSSITVVHFCLFEFVTYKFTKITFRFQCSVNCILSITRIKSANLLRNERKLSLPSFINDHVTETVLIIEGDRASCWGLDIISQPPSFERLGENAVAILQDDEKGGRPRSVDGDMIRCTAPAVIKGEGAIRAIDEVESSNPPRSILEDFREDPVVVLEDNENPCARSVRGNVVEASSVVVIIRKCTVFS